MALRPHHRGGQTCPGRVSLKPVSTDWARPGIPLGRAIALGVLTDGNDQRNGPAIGIHCRKTEAASAMPALLRWAPYRRMGALL